jgi:hypothetical protein
MNFISVKKPSYRFDQWHWIPEITERICNDVKVYILPASNEIPEIGDKSRNSYQTLSYCLTTDKSQWKITHDLSISNQIAEK